MKNLKDNKLKKSNHNSDYDDIVPNEIFDIEDSDEIAEAYTEMFGY